MDMDGCEPTQSYTSREGHNQGGQQHVEPWEGECWDGWWKWDENHWSKITL